MQVHGTTDNSSVTANCPALLLNSDGSLNTGTGTTAGQVQGNVASGATDAGNPVKVGGVYNSTSPTLTNGQRGDLQLGVGGRLAVGIGTNGASADGFNNSLAYFAAINDTLATGQRLGAIASHQFNGTAWDRVTKATATSRIVSAAADTNATVAKASAGTLHSITGYNAAAAVRYLKLYNKATAPTVGTDTPVMTIAIKPSDYLPPLDLAQGRYFATGISYALTTGSADSDTGALTAADIVGLNVNYS